LVMVMNNRTTYYSPGVSHIIVTTKPPSVVPVFLSITNKNIIAYALQDVRGCACMCVCVCVSGWVSKLVVKG